MQQRYFKSRSIVREKRDPSARIITIDVCETRVLRLVLSRVLNQVPTGRSLEVGLTVKEDGVSVWLYAQAIMARCEKEGLM